MVCSLRYPKLLGAPRRAGVSGLRWIGTARPEDGADGWTGPDGGFETHPGLVIKLNEDGVQMKSFAEWSNEECTLKPKPGQLQVPWHTLAQAYGAYAAQESAREMREAAAICANDYGCADIDVSSGISVNEFERKYGRHAALHNAIHALPLPGDEA